MVERRLGYAGLLADLLHAGGVITKGREKNQCVFQDSLAVIHVFTIPYGIVICQVPLAGLVIWIKVFGLKCFRRFGKVLDSSFHNQMGKFMFAVKAIFPS